MSELNLLQGAAKIAEERMKDAQKRLTTVETRLAAIDRELAMLDGDLAKLKGEAETAEQRIKLAEDTAKDDSSAPKLDPSRILPAFERAKAEFRSGPTAERLDELQKMCSDIGGALASTPETKALLTGIDCDPKVTADAAAELFIAAVGHPDVPEHLHRRRQAGRQHIRQTRCSRLRANVSPTARCRAKTPTHCAPKSISSNCARDDKAHRFVVTWNAFQDGNRLAYLALAIALAIDSSDLHVGSVRRQRRALAAVGRAELQSALGFAA